MDCPGAINEGFEIAKKINIYFSRRQRRGNGGCGEREDCLKGGVAWAGQGVKVSNCRSRKG